VLECANMRYTVPIQDIAHNITFTSLSLARWFASANAVHFSVVELQTASAGPNTSPEIQNSPRLPSVGRPVSSNRLSSLAAYPFQP
jgi:hypothetical protein